MATAMPEEPTDLENDGGARKHFCAPRSQEDYAKTPTIIKFVEGQTGFATLLIWVVAVLTFTASNFLWGGIYAALAFLHGLQVWYIFEHGDYFAKLSARLFGQSRTILKIGLLVVFEAVLIIVVVSLIQYALAQ